MNELKGGKEKSRQVQGLDLFRRKERAIKRFAKSRIEGLTGKRKWQQNDDNEEDSFSWNETVDVYSTINRDLTFIDELSSCCSPISHACSNPTKVYSVNCSSPGLFLLSGALCESQQVFWATKALECYSTVEHTNLTNLSRLYEAEDPTVGEKPKAMEELECDIHQLWQKSVLEKRNYSSFDKLRWSCLGYHYDWTKRSYQKNLKSDFPTELATLCQNIASKVSCEFVPEAAIVNFYPLNSTMGGHLDDAEHDLTKPIVSISLGRPAIFLIGGKVKTVDPLPILVRSGDAVVMSGESRLCYHGIPLILSDQLEKDLQINSKIRQTSPDEVTGEEMVLDYLTCHRININVRQVKVDVQSDNWIDKSGTGHVKYLP